MTRQDANSKCNEIGITYSDNQAMSGSLYIRMGGVQYRIADHDQPSHYQIKNYINVGSIEEAVSMAIAERQKTLNALTKYVDANGITWYGRFDDANGFYTSTIPQSGVDY